MLFLLKAFLTKSDAEVGLCCTKSNGGTFLSLAILNTSAIQVSFLQPKSDISSLSTVTLSMSTMDMMVPSVLNENDSKILAVWSCSGRFTLYST